eukprot:CAMPEP_0119417650 /NCGR_PEP_ID=MMETSP1335-20130426/16348_1 /TAXON_ID=259385 /ORGANISM="Chrysoculter rhomboideus, Strain RCC1486" /LENGTH=49 /DNA_ID=CAMNT_0007442843 /DNA_START=240 /DNA_END=389 /DNA_ORIENTATION=+
MAFIQHAVCGGSGRPACAFELRLKLSINVSFIGGVNIGQAFAAVAAEFS